MATVKHDASARLPKQGDRVRVIYEAVWRDTSRENEIAGYVVVGEIWPLVLVPRIATIEVLAPPAQIGPFNPNAEYPWGTVIKHISSTRMAVRGYNEWSDNEYGNIGEFSFSPENWTVTFVPES